MTPARCAKCRPGERPIGPLAPVAPDSTIMVCEHHAEAIRRIIAAVRRARARDAQRATPPAPPDPYAKPQPRCRDCNFSFVHAPGERCPKCLNAADRGQPPPTTRCENGVFRVHRPNRSPEPGF